MTYSRLRRSDEEWLAHFLARVDRSAGPDACWIWTARFNDAGYGMVRAPASQPRKSLRVHRVYYELVNGPIPDGLVVRHKCDNPPCCNPAHLVAGTQYDNVLDAIERGRTSPPPTGRGELCNSAKLTDAQVIAARAARMAGERVKDLAERYGVSRPAMSHVLARRTWQHV